MSTNVGGVNNQSTGQVDLQRLREARQTQLDARVNEARLKPEQSLTPEQVKAQHVLLNQALGGVDKLSGNSVGDLRLDPDWPILFPGSAEGRIHRATRPGIFDNKKARNIKRGYAALNNEANRERTQAARIAAKLGPGEHTLSNGDRVTVTVDPRTGRETVEIARKDGTSKTVTFNKNDPERVSITRTDKDGGRETITKDGTKVSKTDSSPFYDEGAGPVTTTYDVDSQGNATRTVTGPARDDYEKTTVNGDGSTDTTELIYYEDGEPVYNDTHQDSGNPFGGWPPEPPEPWRPFPGLRFPWDLDPHRATYPVVFE